MLGVWLLVLEQLLDVQVETLVPGRLQDLESKCVGWENKGCSTSMPLLALISMIKGEDSSATLCWLRSGGRNVSWWGTINV